MAHDERLTIGELSQRTGMAASALRYYEDLGLIPEPQRESGHRRYPPHAPEQVGVILFLRDVGFSLAEIKELMDAPRGAWRELTRRKIADLDSQIADAQVAKGALEHALRCRHEDVMTCPTFWDVVARRLAGHPLEEAHAPG